MGKPAILYDNRLADATPVVSDTAAGDFDVLNLIDWRAFSFWKPATMPATVTVDSGAAAAADYCLIYGHDLGTQGATVEVRGSTDNFVASNVLIDSATPTDDKPLLLIFTSSYRYWRLRFTGANAPSIAIAAIGSMLRLPKYLPVSFDPLGRKPVGQVNNSADGHALGSIVNYEQWAADIQQRSVDWAWVRDTFEPAWKAHLLGRPFGFAWNPETCPTETYLVSRHGGFEAPHKNGQYADFKLPVIGRYPS